MAYYPDSQKKYNQEITQYSVKYRKHEEKEANRIKYYLSNNNISFNVYIKGLIKEDLDRKEIPYPDSHE